MVVSEGQGPGAGEAVEVAAAVGALDRQPACPHGDDRQGTRVGPCRRFARRLAPQDPLVRRARSLARCGITVPRPLGFPGRLHRHHR